MKHRHTVTKLSKMLVYVLGRQPDAFGLIPDAQGYVKVKDLLKALGEEPGWRHVRSAHIREVGYSIGAPPVETKDNLIRAVDRSRLPSPEIPADLPKLLYYRGSPASLPRRPGKRPAMPPPAVGSSWPMIGRHGPAAWPADRSVTRHPDSKFGYARKKGASLWRFGKHLFLSDILAAPAVSVAHRCPKKPEPKKADAWPNRPTPRRHREAYYLDLTIDSIARKRALKKITSDAKMNGSGIEHESVGTRSTDGRMLKVPSIWQPNSKKNALTSPLLLHRRFCFVASKGR
jgi:putative RNA 2'-phosphotransferase